MHINAPLFRLSAAFCCAFLLTACEPAKTDATQIAASVNGNEISLHQLNHVLARAGQIAPEQIDATRRRALENLIDQQLLAEQAVREKLDRTPENVIALELARREILAQAYLEQLARNGEKLGNQEVTSYYYQHPALFAERRIYNLQEITLEHSALAENELEPLLAANHSLDALAKQLEARQIAFRRGGGVRAAEQLPMHALESLHKARDGQIVLVKDDKEYSLVLILASRQQAVTLDQARPAIQQFLANQRLLDLRKRQIDQLRASAKIDYAGSFATPADAKPPVAASGKAD